MTNRPDVFKGDDGQWYWRIVNVENGKSVGVGGEGFTERNDAAEALVDAVTALDLDWEDE